jgi:hypothetical protein
MVVFAIMLISLLITNQYAIPSLSLISAIARLLCDGTNVHKGREVMGKEDSGVN